MNYLVFYDVPVEYDKIRTKIAETCKIYGLFRIQLSVFWGTLTQALLRELAVRINDLIGNIPVDIRFIAVCSKCFQKSFAILNNFAIQTKGVVKLEDHPLFSMVSHTDVGWDSSDLQKKSKRGKNKKKKEKMLVKIPPIKIEKIQDLENITFEEMIELTGADLSLTPPLPNLKLPDFDKLDKIETEKEINKHPSENKKIGKTKEIESNSDIEHHVDSVNSEEKEEEDVVSSKEILQGKTCSFYNWDSKRSLISPQFLPMGEKYDIADKKFMDESESSKNLPQNKIEAELSQLSEIQLKSQVNEANSKKSDDKFLSGGKNLAEKPIKKKKRYRGIVDLDVLMI